MSRQTVTINGTVYDAHTGMPMRSSQGFPSSTNENSIEKPVKEHDSQTIHQAVQKSQTLNRATVKKNTKVTHPSTSARPAKIQSSVQKSPLITKFAPHPSGAKTPVKKYSDIGPVAHPLVTKANAQITGSQQPTQTTPKPSRVIKEEAIQQAIKKAPTRSETEKQPKHKKYPRALSIASASLALLLLGGYFTYLNMPSLSVRVAAAQAGINATYPEYRPDGYSLHGPVAYDQNEVMMKFAANAGPQNFTVTQAKSSWDSSAVLDNYVKQKAGDNYITYNERGLTIYTFDGNAAWVNGGILYTINGDAPLSTDQIRRIATSM